jgi:hypothetical protein
MEFSGGDSSVWFSAGNARERLQRGGANQTRKQLSCEAFDPLDIKPF